MSYTEWKHGWISDDEYATEYQLDDIRATRFETVEDQEEEQEKLRQMEADLKRCQEILGYELEVEEGE